MMVPDSKSAPYCGDNHGPLTPDMRPRDDSDVMDAIWFCQLCGYEELVTTENARLWLYIMYKCVKSALKAT